MIKTRTWVIGIIVAAALLAVLSIVLLGGRKDGTVVQVIQDGTVIREIDLARVNKEYSFVVETDDGGSNTILVQPGRICISEANCPDQICVLQGWLSDDPTPLVCLPHRLIIMLKDPAGAESDAVAR